MRARFTIHKTLCFLNDIISKSDGYVYPIATPLCILWKHMGRSFVDCGIFVVKIPCHIMYRSIKGWVAWGTLSGCNTSKLIILISSNKMTINRETHFIRFSFYLLRDIFTIQYFPWIMPTVRALLCSGVVWHLWVVTMTVKLSLTYWSPHSEIGIKFYISNFQANFSNWRLGHRWWSYAQVLVNMSHLWYISNGSGNGLVPSGSKPLSELKLT